MADLPGRPLDAQLLGYAALIEHYDLECPPPRRLTALSNVGQKTTQRREGVEWLLLPRTAKYQIPETPIEHIGVALKHEGVDLRVINRLFSIGIEHELTEYIRGNPRGIYTRKAWFLYEWMTGNKLDIEEPYGVRYVDLLDPTEYITRQSTRSSRHKIDNNLTGVPNFCPLIRRTERLTTERVQSLAREANQAVSDADPAVLRRAVGFMLLNESKGSFGIEGETPPRNRLERWGRLIADAGEINLSTETIEDIHRSLFDPKQHVVKLGLRNEGGFVGRHDMRDQTPIPDHVSARHDDLTSLLSSLFEAYGLLRKSQFDPVLTATILGFGFVFIHPFEDGNGRLHRFLIQKALVDMNFNPRGVILPVSAAILEDLVGYRNALEAYSRHTLSGIDWKSTEKGNVEVLNDTSYLYRYFDATRQSEYLLDRIERTVKYSLPAELTYIQRFDDAKKLISEKIDLPDRLSSLLIQFCAQNGGTLSRRKREEYFDNLDDRQVEQVEEAVRESRITELHT